MDETMAATGDNSKLFTAAFDHLVVGNFNDDSKIISNIALLAGQIKDAANMKPANWTDVGKSDATRLTRKSVKVVLLGCMKQNGQRMNY